MGLDPGLGAARGQAPGRLPARRGRLLRRPDRAREPALHGAPQRARPRRGRDGHRRGPRAGRADRPGQRPGRDLLARHAPAARHRRRAGQVAGPAHPRRADDLDRPARRRRDPGPAAQARRRAWARDHAVEPPADPGPVGVRPDRDLRRRPPRRRQGTVDELAAQFGDGTAVIEVGLELPDAGRCRARGDGAARAPRWSSRSRPPGAGSGTWRIHVRPADAEGRVRQDILVAAVDHGLRLTALAPVVPSLDDIYRAAVERPAPPAEDRRQAPIVRPTEAEMSATVVPAQRAGPDASHAERPVLRVPHARLAGHRGQGARRPPAERPVHRAADRARAGRRDPALLRGRPDPRGGAPGERRAGRLPAPVHRRLARYQLLRVDVFVGHRRAAARPGLCVRRGQRRAIRGHAAAPARPADLPRRRHQRQVRGGHGRHRAGARRGHRADRRLRHLPPRDRPARPRRSSGSSPGSPSRSCTSRSGWRSGCCCRSLIRRAATAAARSGSGSGC